jgi:hypothetical protein
MMNRLLPLLFLSVTFVVLTGCGPSKPVDFPKVASCRITVLKDGEPISGVTVSLVPSNGNGAVIVEANTDSSGIAVIRTRWGKYSRRGAPIGVSKVVLIKHVELPDDGMTESRLAAMSAKESIEYGKKRDSQIDALREIPKRLSELQTTPLEIDIIEKGSKLTIDITQYAK